MKVRGGGKVVNSVVLNATGANADGCREVLGLQTATAETGAAWNTFVVYLTARSLTGVRLVASHARAGLKDVIAANLAGTAWQRCGTHYAANLMSVTLKSMWPAVRAMLKSVCDQPDGVAVNAQFGRPPDYVGWKPPDGFEHLDDARDEIRALTRFLEGLLQQVWSKNANERLDRGIPRRSESVGIPATET